MGHAIDRAVDRKPVAWKIMQLITTFAVPSLLIGGLRLAAYAQRVTPRGDGTMGAVVFSVFFALSMWSLTIMVTARRRMAVVRWLGGAYIALMILISLAALCFLVDGMKADNATDAVLTAGATVVIVAECWWLYAFAFSAEAARYVDPA